MNTNECAIWLYGSYAREDFDEFSDIDILIAGNPDVDQILQSIWFEKKSLSLSQYDWEEIEIMAGYGSLFLHHLKLEGRPLFTDSEGNNRLLSILESLCPYRYASRDVMAFSMCLNDVMEGTQKGSTPIFEMSGIATVLRHASVLASYIVGHPKFGRIEPFQYVAKSWGFSDEVVNDFQYVYQFRQYEDGLDSLPFEPKENSVKVWLRIAEDYISLLKEETYAYEKRMLTVN